MRAASGSGPLWNMNFETNQNNTFLEISRPDGVIRSTIIDSNDTQSMVLFYLTYVSSIASAAFGCTKCLKVGVASIMGEDGPFDGLCSGRFLVAFFGKYFLF